MYDNIVCDGCGESMHDSEDIVVCPVCGTPQHRDCYNKNNCCVNEHLHKDGFVWKAPEKPNEQEEAQTSLSHDDSESKPQSPISTIRLDPMNANQMNSLFMEGINASPEEDIDGAKVRETAVYIQNGSRRYIKKFLKHKGKKHFISWNWAAFFFNPCWFFYRKLYKIGFIFLGISVAINVAFYSLNESFVSKYNAVSDDFSEVYSEYTKEQSAENEKKLTNATEKYVEDIRNLTPSALFLVLISFVIPNTIAALIANSEYKKKMLNDINMAHKCSDDPAIINLSLMRSGGVSFFFTIGALTIWMYLPSILIDVIELFIK